MAIVISGSSGFVGQALTQRLAGDSSKPLDGIVALSRRPPKHRLKHVHYPIIDGPWSINALAEHIKPGDCLVHLAGRAHQGSDCPEEEARLQQQAHLELSQNLAKAAQQQNAKRIIYISSAKVFAQSSTHSAFSAESKPAPVDPYGHAKWQTEQWLQAYCKQHAIELIILRPGLVYDLHAKGNIARLQSLIRSGLPLPFAGLKNRRDMISLANFCHLIEHCLDCPIPANNLCIAADGQSMSSGELIDLLANAQGRKAKQFALPAWLLRLLCKIPAFNRQWQKLSSDFALDNRRCNIALGWHAPFTPAQSLAEQSFSKSSFPKNNSRLKNSPQKNSPVETGPVKTGPVEAGPVEARGESAKHD